MAAQNLDPNSFVDRVVDLFPNRPCKDQGTLPIKEIPKRLPNVPTKNVQERLRQCLFRWVLPERNLLVYGEQRFLRKQLKMPLLLLYFVSVVLVWHPKIDDRDSRLNLLVIMSTLLPTGVR